MSHQNEQPEEMSFWDHLDALRKVLINSGLIVVVISLLFFSFMFRIFDSIILAPTSSNFVVYRWMCALSTRYDFLPDLCNNEFKVDLMNYNLNSQFFVHMSTSFWLGLVFSFPIVVYQLWSFISPALYEHEKKNARIAFFFGNIMFYLGLFVGYMTIFPMTLRFLATYQVSEMVPNIISLDSYMSNFLTLIFMMGIVFELPLLCWLLSRMGLLTRSFFKKYRRYAIVIMLIVAAVITPADPFSMIIMFFPLYLLYEGSAFVVRKDIPEDEEEEEEEPETTSESNDQA
ncbi:MAG: twin-arginine translocase subunit TatC [Bacteroidales bacterium]|nr:twin-arginine translocase subunit TatC [Bacteroidales bacterium]